MIVFSLAGPMRVRMIQAAGVVTLLIGSAGVADAGFVVYDDFSSAGSTPDPTRWGAPGLGQVPVQSGGSIHFDTSSGYTPLIRSTAAFSYGTFRITVDGFGGGLAHLIGLNSSSNFALYDAVDALYVRDDSGAAVYANGVPIVPVPSGWQPTALPTVYTFVWNPGLVEIYRDGTLLLSTTSGIPDEPLRFEIGAYNLSGPPATFSVTEVAYEAFATVPEPSAYAMMAIGLAAAFVAGRRRAG
ncbi:PEP-CTERM sorting domain-containing protein [Paludisphaera mucosa]|uniref:PEP-CTERM sorting domain-containing protein n=1 Tax=Paludisphaera mucosa TaxID=3030827 RepID=A0ABT6FJA0_9BACT|nr:PEP-CTERM sorting domain-containing protein [Paludisphaera mucosa]MDG3007665.1 PEP-CTERM sorting domain-containing protein [Paludisphaera mucosa]